MRHGLEVAGGRQIKLRRHKCRILPLPGLCTTKAGTDHKKHRKDSKSTRLTRFVLLVARCVLFVYRFPIRWAKPFAGQFRQSFAEF
jgi:hypothetical protein